MNWHIDAETARRYVDRATDPVSSASIEAHLVQCGTCQRLLADDGLGRARLPDVGGAALPGGLLVSVWERVDARLDEPPLGLVERLLRRCGATDLTSRLLAAAARTRWSYLAAVALTIAAAIVAASSNRDAAFGTYLMLAPIGPTVATAGAFGRWSDPAHRIIETMPVSPWRVALVRTVAVVLPAVLLTAGTIPFLRERGWLAVAWLLPALALSLTALALGLRLPIEHAAIAVAGGWLAVPLIARARPATLLDAIAGPVQVVALVTIVIAGATLIASRSRFDYQGYA